MTLKDNTFCIYDVQEGKADKIKVIMEELGIHPNETIPNPYYFGQATMSCDRYNSDGIDIFNGNERCEKKETYCKTATEFLEEYREWKKNYVNKPKIKKFMTNIVDRAKFATLSADEKELRNAGLKNSEGAWTNEALLIVEEKKAVELGYKSDNDMLFQVTANRDDVQYSQLDYHNMLEQYGAELLDIAKKDNKEQRNSQFLT